MPRKRTVVFALIELAWKAYNCFAMVEYACNMYGRFILIEYKCLAPATKRASCLLLKLLEMAVRVYIGGLHIYRVCNIS